MLMHEMLMQSSNIRSCLVPHSSPCSSSRCQSCHCKMIRLILFIAFQIGLGYNECCCCYISIALKKHKQILFPGQRFGTSKPKWMRLLSELSSPVFNEWLQGLHSMHASFQGSSNGSCWQICCVWSDTVVQYPWSAHDKQCLIMQTLEMGEDDLKCITTFASDAPRPNPGAIEVSSLHIKTMNTWSISTAICLLFNRIIFCLEAHVHSRCR